MAYISNTPAEEAAMLKTIGVSSVKELFADIDSKLLLTEPLKLEPARSEHDVRKKLGALAAQNKTDNIFVGAGVYNHFSPSVVNHMLLRSEFYTAYTPYQPEVSQGSLQAIFEYQTLMCRLTGMEVSNASLYDGSTALSEAVFMVQAITRKKKILVSTTVHPQYRAVLHSYCDVNDTELVEIDFSEGLVDRTALSAQLDDSVAGVVVSNPTFFGCVEDVSSLAAAVHAVGAKLIVALGDPISLGMIVPPKDADVVIGDGQSFGLPMAFGGPSFGLLACKREYMRRMPGRLAGRTVDDRGQIGYTLTLQAREQHIRREKATSNICTNQTLLAIGATVFLGLVGPHVKELAEHNHQNALYLSSKLATIEGVDLAWSAPFFNEFALKVSDSAAFLQKLDAAGIVGGVDLGKWYPSLNNHVLVCATELFSKSDLDAYVVAAGGVQ